MNKEEKKLFDWFEKYGVTFRIYGDPRGKYWVRGYLEEITQMFTDQIRRAEARGYKRAQEKTNKK